MTSSRLAPLGWLVAVIAIVPIAWAGDGELVQVREDFSRDPGWEGVNNRIVCTDGPTIHQDFGWAPGSVGKGAIGGTIWAEFNASTYGMPIGKPHSLNEPLSASGTIIIKRLDHRSGAYIGFYNSTRQGWRPWSSLALQLSTPSSKMKPKSSFREAVASVTIVPANWRGDGVSHDDRIPLDGKPHRWSFSYDPQALQKNDTRRSQITIQIDDQSPFVGFPKHPNTGQDPAVFDRFGIVNMQTYGQSCELYISDLKINGGAIDLSRDPGWEGRDNRVSFQAVNFHGRHDYGFMSSNWAGASPGEIGGVFWGTEPEDPIHGYYATECGHLTLDDPICFSATACFIDGQPDSGMAIGYFNSNEVMAPMKLAPGHSFPVNQSMGLFIEGPTSVGKQLMAYCSPRHDLATILHDPPLFQPTRERRHIGFTYDPKANGGVGRYTLKLDDKEYSVDLTPAQRKAGARFDRFGVMNIRDGGKRVVVYYDDITYTARRAKDFKPTFHPQEIVKVSYPPAGRRY